MKSSIIDRIKNIVDINELEKTLCKYIYILYFFKY